MTRPLAALTVGAFLLLWPHSVSAASLRRPGRNVEAASSVTDGQASEYEVKAAYIFNLLPFTTWPPTAFQTPTSPLTICVAAPDPFGNLLKQTFQDERVGDHPVVVTDVASAAAVGGCQVLFIGASADADGTIQRAAASGSILTVGEAGRFQQRGGMVTFFIERGRVRFDVNQTSAARTRIQFSSKILQIARMVS